MIMDKKGFTLIELIGVILLLSAVALISTPIINNTIKNTKQKAYNSQKNTLIEAAKRYVTEIRSNDEENFIIHISDLKNNNLIENDNIEDPRDNTILDDSNVEIHVSYDSASKSYIYCFKRLDIDEDEC